MYRWVQRDFIYFPQLLVACAVWLCLPQAMSPIVFFLTGAGVGESRWWEDEWRTALVNGGVASEVRVRCAPFAGARGESCPHWWCNYHPQAGEGFDDARVSDTFSTDIAITAGIVASEVEDAVAAGHRVAFAGSSNGGHVAAEFAVRYGAQYPAVVISLKRLSYARHMPAYVICGGRICCAYAAYGKAW